MLFRSGAPNLSISGLAFSISIVVPFLNMTKQFSGNVSQVSNQINSIVMGLAGTQRIFALIDEQPETDEGYVTLVNAKEGADGTLEAVSYTHLDVYKRQGLDHSLTAEPGKEVAYIWFERFVKEREA